MSNEPPFQEKPDWKGKLSQLTSKASSFLKRNKDGDATQFPTLQAGTQNFASDEEHPTQVPRGQRTLTQTLLESWKTRISPRLGAPFSRGPAPGAGDFTLASPGAIGGGGGGFGKFKFRAPSGDGRMWNFLALLISILLIAYIAADLAAVVIDKFIPEPPPPVPTSVGGPEYARQIRNENDYQIIATRNLFNSRGLIPGDDLPATPTDNNNTPVKTSLPFNLVGTMVLRNELRSIATIEDTSEQRVYPVRVDDEIPGRARIISIEPFRVIFVNPGSGRREFVEIPEEGGAARISLNTPGAGGGTGGVEKVSATNFAVPRTEVDSALGNWEQTLTQARAVPHQENGQPAGFMLLQIVPGSIYDKLGLKNRDVLCGVNGEPINDVSKAMELLSLLKTSSRIDICVKRQGKTSNFTYDIR